jgi:gas vesicle protein
MKRRKKYMRNSAGKFIMGILIGGVIGTAIAMLYAPMDGKKLRKRLVKTKDDIMDDVNDILDDVNDYIGSSKIKAEEVIRHGRKKAESIVSEARKLVS